MLSDSHFFFNKAADVLELKDKVRQILLSPRRTISWSSTIITSIGFTFCPLDRQGHGNASPLPRDAEQLKPSTEVGCPSTHILQPVPRPHVAGLEARAVVFH